METHLSQAAVMCPPAALIQDLGYNAMASKERLRNILSQFPRLSEGTCANIYFMRWIVLNHILFRVCLEDVASIVAMMVRTHSKLPADPDPTLPLTSVFNMALTVPTAPGAAVEKKQTWELYAETDRKIVMTWKIEKFVETLRELYPRLNWQTVYQHSDMDGFYIPDFKAFVMYVDIFKQATNNAAFPLQILFEPWQYVAGFVSLIKQAIQAPIATLNFLLSPHVQRPIDNLYTNTKKSKNKSQRENSTAHMQTYHTFYSLDLIEALLRLGEIELQEARQCFNAALERCPELLLCGIVELIRRNPVGKPFPLTLANEYLGLLMPNYLGKAHSNSGPVLQRLWQLNSQYVMECMIDFYLKDRTFLTRVLDIAQDFSGLTPSGLTQILNTTSYANVPPTSSLFYAIDLAVLAARRAYVNLEKWLHSRVAEHGNQFVIMCISYLQDNLSRMLAGSETANQPKPTVLTDEEVQIFFKCVSPSNDNKLNLNEQVVASLDRCWEECTGAYPRLATPSNLEYADIEAEANSYFQKIYNEEISLPDLIIMLKAFQQSKDARQRDIYACMIHSLFDEYRFFGKYPLKELEITGILLGMLIQNQLINGASLHFGLSLVLESLRKPERMFLFGKWALEQFKSRAHLFDKFCFQVVQIPNLREQDLELNNFFANIVLNLRKSQGDLPEHENKVSDGSMVWTQKISGSMFSSQDMTVEVETQTSFASGPPGFDFNKSPDRPALIADAPPVSMNPLPAGLEPLKSAEPRAPTPEIGARVAHITARTVSGPLSSQPAVINAETTATVKDQKAPLTRADPKANPVKKATVLNGFAANPDTNILHSVPGPEPPPDDTRDKIHFIINNCTAENLKVKAKEMKKVLSDKVISYFCHYMVVRRVVMEANNHELYANFIFAVDSADLKKVMVAETYKAITLILTSSDKLLESDSGHRDLLKNLGAWIGLLTLARNKPVLARYLDLKELIMDAYERSRLPAIIPFAKRVLAACSQSKIFKPPNPWLMAVLALLKEILELPQLKLSSKFEIEVLFREMKCFDIVKPSSILKNRLVRPLSPLQPKNLATKPTVLTRSLSAPSSVEAKRQPEPEQARSADFPAPAPGLNRESPTQQSLTAAARIAATGYSKHLVAPHLIKIPVSIQLFEIYPILKAFVPTAIDRAIREIIAPVVDRSVTIAAFTTRELIQKDFYMEGDEKKMKKAAHQMVQSLTSSLALVTCREPLRVSIVGHMQKLLLENFAAGVNDAKLVDEACEKISKKNLDLGCQLIEKAALDRAVLQIDEFLTPAYTLRRRHREQTGQNFYDIPAFERCRHALPENFRPKKPEGLTAGQLRVYDDFARARPDFVENINDSPAVSAILPHLISAVPAQALPPPMSEEVLRADSTSRAAVPSPTPPVTTSTTPSSTAASSRRSSISSKAGDEFKVRAADSQDRRNQYLDKLLSCLHNVEACVSKFQQHKTTRLASLAPDPNNMIIAYLQMIPRILNQSPDEELDEVFAFSFANKTYLKMNERENRSSLLQIDVHLHILDCIRIKYPKVVSELTSWFLYADDERKYYMEITCGLLRVKVLVVGLVDQYFAKVVETLVKCNKALVSTPGARPAIHQHLEFIINLVRRVIMKEYIVAVNEFPALIETFKTILPMFNQRSNILAEVLTNLLDDIKLKERELKISSIDTEDDEPELEFVYQVMQEEMPAGLRQNNLALFDEWMNLSLQTSTVEKAYAQYLEQLKKSRVFSSVKSTVQFFCLVTQACVDSAYVYPKPPSPPPPSVSHNVLNAHQRVISNQLAIEAAAQAQGQLAFSSIDCLARLIVWLIKSLDLPASFFGAADNSLRDPLQGGFDLLGLYLSCAVYTLMQEFKVKMEQFNQRPYLRLFNNLVQELNIPDPVKFDSNRDGVLLAFAKCFHLLRPAKFPVFAFAWMELISHRMFMSKMLLSKNVICQITFQKRLIDLFVFMQPYLRNAELTQSIRLLYKGTLRILLVLLHDFPSFLCDFHFSFCDVIPTTCIQMRNLILAAFPRNMCLPDPFTPNLKVDILPDIKNPPRISSDVLAVLKQSSATFLPLNQYLRDREPKSLFDLIIRSLSFRHSCNTPQEVASMVRRAGTQFNVPLINSLVIYLGQEGILHAARQAELGLSSTSDFQNNSYMDVFDNLITNLDAEGRYYVLNAIVNQLRYPNTHTHYFSCVLQYLFLRAKQGGQDIIMEQITRVLLERLIVHRPHPWGLLITFIELIKNSRYDFWNQKFIHCAPDIERLFDCVARSCMPKSQ